MPILPESASRDAARLVAARGLRAFADGLVSVLLPVYLAAVGFDAIEVGTVVTATLLGSAALTFVVGLYAQRFDTRRLLLAACVLMLITGLGFALSRELVVLVLVAVVGTLNPSAGDVSVFLPLEQSQLASEVQARELPTLYARSNVIASGSGALGALAAAFPEPLAAWTGLPLADAMRLAFLVYSATAVLAALLYLGLRTHAPSTPSTPGATNASPRAPLARSRSIVLRLAALFTLDSFGGGFVVQSLLALWLLERYAFSLSDAASFFFVASLLSGASQLLSPVLAKRIGLIPTMVYTHIPANLFLIAAAFMPTAPLAVTFLLLRTSLSQMDVPARQAFVMSAVPPEERAAAATVTNVPRSLGTGLAPLLSGMLIAATPFGWPLVIGGSLKIVYDLLLLRSYHDHEASRVT